MLPEGIVAKKDIVAGQVRRHAVGQWSIFISTNTSALPFTLSMESPVLTVWKFHFFVILPGKRFDGIFRAIHRNVRDVADKFAERSWMVNLALIGDDKIDFCQNDFGLQVIHKILRVRTPHRIDERVLAFAD
jgi:hypothetical protein